MLPVAVFGAARGVGSLVGALNQKRQKSACRAVSAADVEGFKRGSVAPWVLDDRVQDIFIATGKYPVPGFGTGANGNPTAPNLGLSVETLAEIHMNCFVPLCQSIEGGKTTDDPFSGAGLATYNAAREAFRDRVRKGQFSFFQNERTEGSDSLYKGPLFGPGVGLDPGSLGASGNRSQGPALAGFGGMGMLLVAGIALFALSGKMKG